MPKLVNAVPKYRKHRASGQAVVSIGGRDYYLGPYGTKGSRVEYDRRITEWLAKGRKSFASEEHDRGITITELLARYWQFAEGYYRDKHGRLTRRLDNIRLSLRPLRRLYGHTPAAEFGPLALKAVRQTMLNDGLCRRVINDRIGDIRGVFKWAAGEELLPPHVHQALRAVSDLRRGRTEAPEPEPVGPVDDKTVDATLPYLLPVVADMVWLQRLTGARPGEICILRPRDVDRSADVWQYVPESHKTEHQGRSRTILIGPQAQEVLTKYLLRPADSYCFSPAEAVGQLRAERHAARKTPPSCGNRPGTNRKLRPKRQPRHRYDSKTYRRAIQRGVEKANAARLRVAKENDAAAADVELLSAWSPNQLRHSAATEIRRRYGLEAAQVVLGHAMADVTQVYAERDLELARRVMAEVG